MKRFRSDSGSASFVTFVLSFMFLLLAVAVSIDLAKSAYVKNSFTSTAQQSVQVAIKNMDGRGSIRVEGLENFVENYNGQSNDGNKNATFAKSSANFYKSDVCKTIEVDGYGDREVPFIVMKLDTKRSIGADSEVIYVSENGRKPVLYSGSYNPGTIYRVLDAEVYDSADNLMLSIFGMPCQKTFSKVSAIHFGDQQDLKELEKEQTPVATIPTARNEIISYCPYIPSQGWQEKVFTAPSGYGIKIIDKTGLQGGATVSGDKIIYVSPENRINGSTKFTYAYFNKKNPDSNGDIGTITINDGC